MVNNNQQQEKSQDFEPIELLLGKVDSSTSNAVDQLDQSFEARYQSLIDQIQSYLHSSEKPGFFPHRFLGSFSSVLDTKLSDKLGIKKLHFRFEGARTLKVVAETEPKTYVFIFTEEIEAQHSNSPQTRTRNFEFTTGEFKSVMGRDYTESDARKLQIDVIKILKDKYELVKSKPKSDKDVKSKKLYLYVKKDGVLEYVAKDIHGGTKAIQINRDELKGNDAFKNKFFDEIKQFLGKSGKDLSDDVRKELSRLASVKGYTLKSDREDEKINIKVERKKIKNEPIAPPAEFPFQEVTKKLDKSVYLEDYIEKLISPDTRQVKDNLEKILTYAKEVHTNLKLEDKNKGNVYGIKAREADQHGFVAGIFDNFRYRDNTKLYLEQFAGRGYADIVLLVRGPDRAVDSVPILIELKAGTEGQVTTSDALRQAEDYIKGFRPNKMRILTNAGNAIAVGLNLDNAEPFKTEVKPIKQPSSLMEDFIELASKWSNQQISEEIFKQRATDLLSSEYYTFTANKETRDIYYFSRYTVGQSILVDKFDGTDVEKYVFSYGEYPLESKTRGGAQSKERPVTTLVFIKGDRKQDKTAFVFHIIEQETEIQNLNQKKVPVIDIPEVGKIENVIEITMGLKKYKENSSFKDLFEIKQISKYNPSGNDQQFTGNFLKIPNSDELKAKLDQAITSQHATSSDSKDLLPDYKKLLTDIADTIDPIKGLITDEAKLQAVLNGLLSSYSDLKLKETSAKQEDSAKIVIIPEFQTGAGGRVDMVIQGIGPSPQGTKEYTPIALEFKLIDKDLNEKQMKEEVDELTKEQNIRYAKGAALKAITDSDKMFFMGVVVNMKAKDKNSLILTSDKFVPATVVHSSIHMIHPDTVAQSLGNLNLNDCVGQSSRSKRSINNCLFSKGDVEKFSKGKVDENNVDKIIIDSEEFLTYVKSSQDEKKNAQLIEFVGDKSIEGDRKYLLDKVIEDQGYERYVQNERTKDLYSDVSQQTSSSTKNSKLKGRLMNAAGGIQLIRGIHGAIVSCKDGTATDCGLNLGGIAWSFASQPIENVMVKITPKVVVSAEKVVGKIIPGTLGKQTKFAIRVVGVKFGSTIARGVAGAVGGVFDIVDIGMSASNLVDCKKRENSDNPCGEKEIRDNIASISFSGVSFVSGVALTAASMPVVGIAVGFGLMVGYGIYSGVSNIVEYKKKYDTTHGENWSIFWRTLLFQPMAADVQHLAARKDTVNSLAKQVWKALNNGPNSTVAYGIGLGKVSGNTLRPDYATIMMNRTNANTKNLSRVVPDDIKGASRICLSQITNQDYEKGIKSSVPSAKYYCNNAMVINHDGRVNMEQKDKTIVYDLQNVNRGTIVGSNVWNNNFLIYSGTAGITGGNNVANRFVLVNNPSFSGKIIGGNNSTNILDLSQLKDTVIGVNINYRFKPSAHGQLKVKINNRLLIDDYVSNNLFNYHYIGRQSKVDEILCMGYSEHFTGIDDRDVIIDSGGGSNNNKKDIVENCKKVIISPYTTVKGRKSHYTFYVKTADYKGRGLYSEIDVDGTGTVVFPEIDLLGDCDQITYSVNSNTLSLKVNFGQNNQFTLDIKNYVEKSSNKPHFVLIDKNGSNIVPKIERSDSSTIEIKSFELHSEHPLNNFNDVENRYKKILNNHKSYKVFGVIRDKVQNQSDSVVPHMVFGSLEDDIINFDQGTVFAKGGKGNDVYVVGDSIGNKEVKIDNNSDDEKLDMLLMPVVKKDFSIQQCDLHLNYNNTSIQVKNYLQGHNYRHLIVMNDKGEAFIPNIQSMSCSPSSSEKGKLVPFLQAIQTQNMFLLSKDFQDDHIVIDSHLEDIEKYKDKDDLLLIRESEIPFIIRMEGFYIDRSKWENISYSLWNNNDLFPSSGLLENVDDVMDYKDKLRTDYERIVKEYVIDFSNSTGTIKHNQKLERDISTFVGQDEERIGVIILKNITPDRVEISNNGADLIFCDKRSNHTVNIKSWNNIKSYRISTLEFDLDLESIIIRKLDRFNLSEVRKIQDLIEKASENYKNKDKYTPKIENDFKCLVSIDSFESENKNSTYQCLGFSSLQDQINFAKSVCSAEQLTEFRDKSNSTQISALSRKLQNNLSLNGYDQNVVDQCSKLILAEENNQQVASKISSMVKNIEESTSLHHIAATSGRSLSKPKNGLNLGSCLGHRRKRDTNRCLALWKDIDKFNEEESEKRNVNKIKINSEIFVYYIKDVEDESRRVQLIDLASQVEVTGKFQGLVNKIVSSREAISHLNKVGKVSGALMYGVMAKNALADFLNDDYKGVAINLGFIAGGRGLTKIAKAVSTKGVGLITDGKILLGRSLKAASPFLARGTSAFVVYDLVNQIKELESGDKDALIPVIGDSIYLGVDAAEIGIEVAEAFEVLEGVSSVTGPIGAAIGTVVFIGTDIYMSVKRVDKLDKVVHLTGGEKFIEGLRAFVGMKPEQYVEELMDEKQANNQLVKQGLEYLKQHNDISRYVFPTGKSVKDNNSCITVTEKGPCTGNKFCNPSITKREKCQEKIQVDLDNVAYFDKEVGNVIYDRAKPDDPDEGELFCLPADPIRPESGGKNAYLCHDAIGLSYSANKTGNYTLIALGKGKDKAMGFKYSPNAFLVDDGDKAFTGGDKDDLFILVGNKITGRLDGGSGSNTLNLAESSLGENLNIKLDLHENDSSISSSSNNIRIKNMNIIYGRKGKQDIVDCGCDVRYVDGQGGISNNSPDNITIPYCYRPSEKKIIVRPSTEINNLDQSSNGIFDYIILPDKGKANINIEPDYTFTRQRKHNFLFNYTLFDLASVDIANIKDINHWHAGYGNMTYTIRNVTFSFLSPLSKGKSINEKFDITISDIPANASYILSDNTEINVGKNNSYAMHSTNKAIDEIVKSYPTVADHLKMSLFISANNETVVIGHGNHDIINNNFLQKSHLIGSGGENIHIITSGHETLDIENLPIPEVTIYDDFNKKESLRDTLDLRQLVQQINSNLSIEPISKVTKDKNDLLIKLSISATGLQQDVATVRLKDAFVNNWYKELQIILNNAPMKIDDNLDLSPLPLTFDEEIVVVTSKDVEGKDKLIISKEAGQLTFLHSEYDLMITNAFNADVETNKLCTICLKDFYREPKMETLSIKFTDKEILLSDEMDKINNADSISDKLNINDYISSIVKLQESSAPLEAAIDNRPIRHRRHKDHSRQEDDAHHIRHKHHRVQKHNSNYQDSHYYIDQPEIAASGSTRPSSWINDLFSWVKSSISRLLDSRSSTTTKSPISQVDAPIDINGTIMLLDVLIRKVTGQKYISTVDQSISPREAQNYALSITKRFEKVVEQAASKSGISMHRLNIDYMGMQKEITRKVMSGKFNEISGVLSSYLEESCPGREVGCPGKLSPKKFEKFIAQFNKGLLNQSIEQILHNRDGRLEVDGAKQMSLEPQSYLSNASIQSHSKDKVSTCLSDVGVTKIENNLSR